VSFCAVLPAQAGAGPLRTAITDMKHFGGPQQDLAFARTKQSGASVVRLVLTWRSALFGDAEPGDATNPNDPAYNWGWFDDQVRAAKQDGLEIIASIQGAPDFAQAAPANDDGTHKPSPTEYAKFAQAAATRYNGLGLLPRIRYWQAWNEANRSYFLWPQYEGGELTSPARYRALLNAFADAVHGVRSDNLVVTGGLAPLGTKSGPSPLAFMRRLLSEPTKFDVWSHHPYTSGGPTHRAPGDGVALGDLGDIRKLLNQSIRAGRVLSARKVQFWVTEFSWDTNGPDPKAVPMSLHARWTSEALYRMWRQGVSLVTWFRIQDDPLHGPTGTPYQSGFYTVAGARKRSFTAFRFPFVAFRQPGKILVWGRTPTSTAGYVRIQQRVGGNWRLIGAARASSAGIFTRTVRTSRRTGLVRARVGTAKSLGFSLTPVSDRYYNPFGCGGQIAC